MIDPPTGTMKFLSVLCTNTSSLDRDAFSEQKTKCLLNIRCTCLYVDYNTNKIMPNTVNIIQKIQYIKFVLIKVCIQHIPYIFTMLFLPCFFTLLHLQIISKILLKSRFLTIFFLITNRVKYFNQLSQKISLSQVVFSGLTETILFTLTCWIRWVHFEHCKP